jgi:hypothetical protein
VISVGFSHPRHILGPRIWPRHAVEEACLGIRNQSPSASSKIASGSERRQKSRYDIIFGSEAPVSRRVCRRFILSKMSAEHLCRSRHLEAILTNKYSNFKQALQLQSLFLSPVSFHQLSVRVQSTTILYSIQQYCRLLFQITISEPRNARESRI